MLTLRLGPTTAVGVLHLPDGAEPGGSGRLGSGKWQLAHTQPIAGGGSLQAVATMRACTGTPQPP